MGIRDRATEAKDLEEGRIPELENTTGHQSDLFTQQPTEPYPGYFSEGYYGGYKKKEQYVKGTIKMEIIVTSKEIGNIGTYDDPDFDYDKMMEKAQDVALTHIENFAGKDVLNRYSLSFSSEEYGDEIQIMATLTPALTE